MPLTRAALAALLSAVPASPLPLDAPVRTTLARARDAEAPAALLPSEPAGAPSAPALEEGTHGGRPGQFTQFFAGFGGTLVGLGLGALGASASPEAGLTAGFAGVLLGTSVGSYLVGEAHGGSGTYRATLLGTGLGTLAGAGVSFGGAAFGAQDWEGGPRLLPGFAIALAGTTLPSIGALVGYNLSDDGPPDAVAWQLTGGVAGPHGAHLGVVGRF